jgi:hypothetical protein
MTFPPVLVAALAAVLTIWVPSAALGQSAPQPANAQQRAQKKSAPARKVLRLEELKVEGRIQKPQAMFLMPRANLNYGDLERSEPLLPKVVQAVEKEPF